MSPQKRYSNFTSTTILAQNTDGWQSNWASSYQNILSGTPTKMRVSGTAPSIKRSFNTIQANDQHTLTYTQTGNNSLNLLVEQSPNGSTWNAIYNAATSNGNNTHSFTPTQSYLRVSYDANEAFEIGDVVLSGMHVDTVVNVIAGGYASYRYQFNGMEKDDEVKGSGNSYNFGARMYDARLGRWYIRDDFEAFYTSVSPYSYALNNPISNIDVEGQFVIEGTIEQKNQLTKVINATRKALATNPYLLERLKLHSGLSENEIIWLLTDDKGAILQFKKLGENELGEFEGPLTELFLKQSQSVNPKTFKLSLSSNFENTDILDDDQRFLLVMIILHEMCHIGDNRNSIQGDVIDYSELEKTEVLKKGFVKEAKTQTIDAKYDPTKWAQGIEVGKGFEVDLTGYSINNDSTLRNRRKVFESKSNKYDEEKSKERGEPAPTKEQPRF